MQTAHPIVLQHIHMISATLRKVQALQGSLAKICLKSTAGGSSLNGSMTHLTKSSAMLQPLSKVTRQADGPHKDQPPFPWQYG